MLFKKKSLRKFLLLAILEFGAVCGVPMRPQEIEDLLNVMNRTVVVMKQEKAKD
jgi:hypothetical protein